jgi:hypothetical protein
MEQKETITNTGDEFMAKKKIVNEYIEKYKNEPKQQSPEWLAKRAKTVGGSELDTLINNKAEFVARKIGLRGNFSGMATIWGQVMEQVAREYLSMIYDCEILEASSLPSSQVVGKSYSPDGIGVALMDKISRIILFEIKCVFSRVLKKGKIYKPYIPQIMSGMCDIPIIEQGVYAEFVFKLCSVKSLTTNPYLSKREAKAAKFEGDDLGINELFHSSSYDYFDNKPVAAGCMIFSVDEKTRLECLPVLNELCKYEGKGVVDIGSQIDENVVYNLFALIKHYEMDTQLYMQLNNGNIDDFVDKLGKWSNKCKISHTAAGLKRLLILPFKLMDTNVVNVKKQDNYTLQYKDLIENALAIVDKLGKIKDIEERRAAWKLEFNKK